MGSHCLSLVLAPAPITYSTHRVLGVHGKVRPHRPADTPVRIWSTHTQVCCCADDTPHTAELHSPLLLPLLRRSAPSRGLLWDLPGAGDSGTAGIWEVGSGLGWMSVMGSSWASMRVSALYICICVVLSLSHVIGTFPRGLCPRWGRTCGLSGIIQ